MTRRDELSYEISQPDGGVPIKRWTRGVAVEDAALRQLENVARLPFIHRWVAAMPDVHWGMGATIGSVIPTVGAIIPAAVGVDIGCGMMASETSLTASDLPSSLAGLRSAIEAAVPHGRTANHGRDKGAWGDPPEATQQAWLGLQSRFEAISQRHRAIEKSNTIVHLGTLGTGNHFIEVCLDERDKVWIMLHSGSRGVGNRIGSYFIAKAKEEMQKWMVHLPDENLAYLPEGSEHFDDYVEAVEWAQDFARHNRELMMQATLAALAGADTHVVVTFPPDGETDARVSLRAGAITYVSSTGVYGDARGVVDDDTPVTATPSPTAARRLEAEAVWRARGATILRCPAIYGPDRGLHRRVVSGQHQIPGDGSGYVSRIHVDDLAALILAAPAARGETFVVGDAMPAPHRDVVAWICERYGVPMPPSIPLERAHESLRGDRRVDSSRALRTLGVTLAYPSYTIGYAPTPSQPPR